MELQSKLFTAVAMGLSGLVVTKVLETGWRLVTGQEPPREEDNGQLLELVVFAGVSAMTIAVAQRLASRQVTKYIASRL